MQNILKTFFLVSIALLICKSSIPQSGKTGDISFFNQISKLYGINNSNTGVKTAGISNNIYVKKAAENNIYGSKTDKVQAKQWPLMITLLSLASLLSALLLFLRLKKKDRDSKERIEKLKYASQLQIMGLEEKNLFIKKEEQKKLGMELHDNLTGTLAALKIKIESELVNNPDAAQVKRLKNISKLVTEIYMSTRNKSHQLYNAVNDEPEIPFLKRIKMITDKVFPAGKFETDIAIDDSFLNNVAIEVKIELLHIIQEAITNVIKHSMADKVSILIYEDAGRLVLHISDNGKGFRNIKKSVGIGLKTIKKRVADIGGTVDIESDKSGTVITTTVPVGKVELLYV